MQLPLIERKTRLAKLFKVPPPSVLYVNHFDNEAHVRDLDGRSLLFQVANERGGGAGE